MTEKSFIQRNILIPATICALLWGSAIPVVKTGYSWLEIQDVFAKFAFAGYRFALAGLMILAFMKFKKQSIKAEKDSWKAIILICLVQTLFQYVFYYLGVGNTSGVRGSILSATSTFFSVIIAHFVFASDKITVKKLAGCIVGFAGVVVMLSGSGLGSEQIKLTGEGFMLLSALGQGIGAVVSRKVATGRNPMLLTGWQLLIGGLVLTLIGVLGGGNIHMSLKGSILLLYLAMLSAVAFTVWTMLLKHHNVAKVTIYMFLVPVFGSLFSAFILKEQVLTLRNIISLVLVCIGIFFVNRVEKVQN